MPARVVVVHDEPEFAGKVATALRCAGHDVAVFADPMVALDALDAAANIEVLVTRIKFAPGKPNGWREWPGPGVRGSGSCSQHARSLPSTQPAWVNS